MPIHTCNAKMQPADDEERESDTEGELLHWTGRRMTDEEVATDSRPSLRRTNLIEKELKKVGFWPGKPSYPGTDNPYLHIEGPIGKYERPAYPLYVLEGNKRIMPVRSAINRLITRGRRPEGTKTIDLPLDIGVSDLSVILEDYAF
jgi:hypothetical protein